jgi:hypothetical protein
MIMTASKPTPMERIFFIGENREKTWTKTQKRDKRKNGTGIFTPKDCNTPNALLQNEFH